MIITIGDVLTIKEDKYLVVETARYEEVDYLFANKLLENEELSKEYYVMKKTETGVLLVTDEKVLEVILPVFQNKIQKDIEKYNEQQEFEIDDNNNN